MVYYYADEDGGMYSPLRPLFICHNRYHNNWCDDAYAYSNGHDSAHDDCIILENLIIIPYHTIVIGYTLQV